MLHKNVAVVGMKVRMQMLLVSLVIVFTQSALSFFVPACRVSELSRSTVKTFLREGCSVALLLNQNYEPVAFQDHCPHRGASFNDASVANNTVLCRYHNYAFSVDTGKLEAGMGVTRGCASLTSVPTSVADDLVWVCVDDDCSVEPPAPLTQNSLAEFRRISGECTIKCTVDALVTNVLDACHISYIHSFGNSVNPTPEQYKVAKTSNRTGEATFFYNAGNTSMFAGNVVKVLNWYNVPVTAGTAVHNGDQCKIVQVHAVQEGTRTRVFWELTRNYYMNPLMDHVFRYAMKVTLNEDKRILETCKPERGNKFHSRYDALQQMYRHSVRAHRRHIKPSAQE